MNTFRAGSLAVLFSVLIASLSAPAADLPSSEEYRANWPRFRGPDGGGVAANDEVPLTCDVQTGANIAWSTEVPAAGFNSPVVWGDRVFLSGGDEEKRVVMCFDVASGKMLWQSAVPKAEGGDDKVEVPDQSGIAAPSVATDGRRVYAIFANGDFAAFNFDGSAAWSKHLAISKNQYGHASSLLTWQDRVIVQLDQGETEDRLSKLTAFDGATGAVVWENARAVGASWATPIVCDASGKPQLVTLALPMVIAYSPQDGAELWRADVLDGEITPSPIFAGGSVFIVSPSNKLQPIRPDGSGDVTKTHVGWMAEDGIPDITSPVSNGELIFLITSSGMLTCYDAKIGKKQWEHDFEEDCKASPSLVGDKLVMITMKGTLVVLGAAREFQEISHSALGEKVFASPAFAKGRMIVRGAKHLICIGAKDGEAAKK